jgi:DNA-binding NarL/FixJ family response regulator
MMIRVLLADDHELVRYALRTVLEAEGDIDIVGEAHNGREAVRLAAERKPDVILMDVSMPEVSGIEATDIIHKTAPDIRIIGLSMHQNAAMRQKMLDAGACAYLTKGGSSEELIETVRRVVSEPGSTS